MAQRTAEVRATSEITVGARADRNQLIIHVLLDSALRIYDFARPQSCPSINRVWALCPRRRSDASHCLFVPSSRPIRGGLHQNSWVKIRVPLLCSAVFPGFVAVPGAMQCRAHKAGRGSTRESLERPKQNGGFVASATHEFWRGGIRGSVPAMHTTQTACHPAGGRKARGRKLGIQECFYNSCDICGAGTVIIAEDQFEWQGRLVRISH